MRKVFARLNQVTNLFRIERLDFEQRLRDELKIVFTIRQDLFRFGVTTVDDITNLEVDVLCNRIRLVLFRLEVTAEEDLSTMV